MSEYEKMSFANIVGDNCRNWLRFEVKGITDDSDTGLSFV